MLPPAVASSSPSNALVTPADELALVLVHVGAFTLSAAAADHHGDKKKDKWAEAKAKCEAMEGDAKGECMAKLKEKKKAYMEKKKAKMKDKKEIKEMKDKKEEKSEG